MAFYFCEAMGADVSMAFFNSIRPGVLKLLTYKAGLAGSASDQGNALRK